MRARSAGRTGRGIVVLGRWANSLTRPAGPLERWTSSPLVWPALAVTVGLSGGRRARRGALRGLLAATLTLLLGRSAPEEPPAWLTGARPRTRVLGRLRPSRVTSSSPAPLTSPAAAFAFTAGTAQEDPRRAVALLPLAVGVALARGRRHDVPRASLAAAAVAGTAVGLATRRLWKVAPAQPAAARRVWSVLAGHPEPEGEGLVVVVNPASGPAWSADPTDELRTRLPSAEVLALGPEDSLDDLLGRGRAARALGIAGGDGTVSAAVEVALEADIPLLVVPAGTLNHFARDLGVETTADAVEAVRAGELVAVDVGMIDGRPFVNTASFGSYADLVDAREQLEDTIGKWPAVVVALVRMLWRGRPAEVEIDGRRTRVWMIFIGNCRYHPEGLAPSWRERLDDGLLDVRLVDGTSPFSRTRLLLAAMTGRLARTPVYRREVVGSLRIRSTEGPLRLARDGETFDGGADVLVTKHPGRLRVFRPADRS